MYIALSLLIEGTITYLKSNKNLLGYCSMIARSDSLSCFYPPLPPPPPPPIDEETAADIELENIFLFFELITSVVKKTPCRKRRYGVMISTPRSCLSMTDAAILIGIFSLQKLSAI